MTDLKWMPVKFQSKKILHPCSLWELHEMLFFNCTHSLCGHFVDNP